MIVGPLLLALQLFFLVVAPGKSSIHPEIYIIQCPLYTTVDCSAQCSHSTGFPQAGPGSVPRSDIPRLLGQDISLPGHQRIISFARYKHVGMASFHSSKAINLK